MAIENAVSSDFHLRLSMVLTFFIAAYPVCYTNVLQFPLSDYKFLLLVNEEQKHFLKICHLNVCGVS